MTMKLEIESPVDADRRVLKTINSHYQSEQLARLEQERAADRILTGQRLAATDWRHAEHVHTWTDPNGTARHVTRLPNGSWFDHRGQPMKGTGT